MDTTERTRGDLLKLLTCGRPTLSNGFESLEPPQSSWFYPKAAATKTLMQNMT